MFWEDDKSHLKRITLYTDINFKYPRYLGYTKNRRGAYHESNIFNNLIINCRAYLKGRYPGQQEAIARIRPEIINSDPLYLFIFV